jgi:hypothetical protein
MNPEVKLLMGFTGIDYYSAMLLLNEIGPIASFHSPKSWSATQASPRALINPATEHCTIQSRRKETATAPRPQNSTRDGERQPALNWDWISAIAK